MAIDLDDNLCFSMEGIQTGGVPSDRGEIRIYSRPYPHAIPPHPRTNPPTPPRPLPATISTLKAVRNPADMDFDGRKHLYVADRQNVLVFDPFAGNLGAPVRTIGGPATGLSEHFVLAVDEAGFVYVGNASSELSGASLTAYAPGARGNAAPFLTISPLDSDRGSPTSMAIRKPRQLDFSPTGLNEVLGLVAKLFGGVARDGGGLVFIQGIPIPVGPWGEASAEMPARRDILVAMAIEQLASAVGDPAGQSKIRVAALNLIKVKVDELFASLR